MIITQDRNMSGRLTPFIQRVTRQQVGTQLQTTNQTRQEATLSSRHTYQNKTGRETRLNRRTSTKMRLQEENGNAKGNEEN